MKAQPTPTPTPRQEKHASLALPRFLFVWLAISFIALAAASNIAASDTQPEGYVPTATFTFTPSSTPTCIPTATPTGGGVSYDVRINAGGSTYSDDLGNVWRADVQFAPCGSTIGWTTGQTSTVPNLIANTSEPELYQEQRYASQFGYRWLLPNGNYSITLGFAETYVTTSGQRRFNIAVNGATVVSNLDVFAAAGGEFIAYDRTFLATVTNGLLSVDFQATVGSAIVSTLYVHQVLPATPTPTITATPSATGTSTRTPTLAPTATASNTATPTMTWTATRTFTPTRTATATASNTGTATPTATSTLTPTSTATPPPLDPYEPNDTFATATNLLLPATLSAYVQSADDADYFQFDLPAGQIYILARLSNLAADYDLRLFDADHVQVAAAQQRGLNDESIAIKAPRAGRYYLLVTGFNHAWSAESAYYLNISLAPPAATPVAGDQFEPNNSMAQAATIVGTGAYSATIDTTSDVDYYALQVPAANMSLSARLTGLPADYDLFLFQGNDSNAIPVKWSMKRGTLDEEVSMATVPGVYYLLVQGYDRSFSSRSYGLSVDLAAATPTATPSATVTRTATPSASATRTATLAPSATPTATYTPTATDTPDPGAPTPTETATETPAPWDSYQVILPVILGTWYGN